MLGLALSAFSWLPEAAESRFTQLDRLVATMFNRYFDYHRHFITLDRLFYTPPETPFNRAGRYLDIGYVHVALAAVAALALKRLHAMSRSASVLVALFLFVVVASAFLATRQSEYIWDRLAVMHLLQFPWVAHRVRGRVP